MRGEWCYKYWPITTHRTNESLPTRLTFSDAQALCAEYHATIPVIGDASMLPFLIDMVGQESGLQPH